MEALRITDRLSDYFSIHSGETGQIHSVFNGAFNIIDSGGNIIGVLSKNKDISPLSMIIDSHSFNHKSIQQGSLCEFTCNGIVFENSKLKINLSSPEVVNLSLNNIRGDYDDILKCKLTILRQIIITEGALSGIAELIRFIKINDVISYQTIENGQLNEYSEFIKDRLAEFLSSILEGNTEKFASVVQKIIGFGPGLTPSTDDFLTGIITIMNTLDHTEYRKMIDGINHLCEGKTTKISEEMIRHASMGYVPESYKKLIEDLYDNDKNNISEAIYDVMQIGSSSGTDFLFGVYCMAMINSEKIRRL